MRLTVAVCFWPLLTGPLVGQGGARAAAVSDVLGVVQTHSGQPVPLAMVRVTLDDETAGRVRGWQDQVLKTDAKGVFRLRVPAGQDYRVCVTVPAKREHCQYATVQAATLATLHFVF